MHNNKCICVPSGCCHSQTLLGCPHNHMFDNNNRWVCVLPKKPKYNVIFDSDMGYLIIKNYSNTIPFVNDFAYKKIKNKIIYATDSKTSRARFYILKRKLQPKWTYELDNMYITLDYSNLNKFNPLTMKLLY